MNSKYPFFLTLCVVAVVASSLSFSGSPKLGSPISLSTPNRKVAFPADFTVASRTTLPGASNGYLLSFSRLMKQSGDPIQGIYVTSLTTLQLARVPFWIAGASAIHLDAGTVTTDHHVLIAGSYVRSLDANDTLHFTQDPSVSGANNFVADIDDAGNLVSVRDLQKFTPERVCSTNDGSFWILGQKWPLEQQRKYYMLRHYSSSGVLEQHFTPSGKFVDGYLADRGKEDAPNYRAIQRGSPQAAFLLCGEDSVGVYVQRSGGYLWSEIDLSSGNLSMSKVAILQYAVPTGMALFNTGSVYATFRRYTRLQSGRGAYGAPLGLYKLDLNTGGQAKWELVPTSADASVYSTLLGRDGQNLVHLQGAIAPGKNPILYWTEVPY